MIGLTVVFKNSETGGRGNGGFHGDAAHCEKRSFTINPINIYIKV